MRDLLTGVTRKLLAKLGAEMLVTLSAHHMHDVAVCMVAVAV